jgi:hypothetical protein
LYGRHEDPKEAAFEQRANSIVRQVGRLKDRAAA